MKIAKWSLSKQFPLTILFGRGNRLARNEQNEQWSREREKRINSLNQVKNIQRKNWNEKRKKQTQNRDDHTRKTESFKFVHQVEEETNKKFTVAASKRAEGAKRGHLNSALSSANTSRQGSIDGGNMQRCGLCTLFSRLLRRAMCVGSRRGSGESYYQELADTTVSNTTCAHIPFHLAYFPFPFFVVNRNLHSNWTTFLSRLIFFPFCVYSKRATLYFFTIFQIEVKNWIRNGSKLLRNSKKLLFTDSIFFTLLHVLIRLLSNAHISCL